MYHVCIISKNCWVLKTDGKIKKLQYLPTPVEIVLLGTNGG